MVERAVRQSHWQSVLARYAEELLCMRSGLPGFAADAGKAARIGARPRDRWKVAALSSEAQRAVQQASRLIDFPERPQDHGQPAGGNNSVVEDEAGDKIVIPLVVIGREGLFEMRPRRRRNRPETSKLRHRREVPGPPPAIRASAGHHAGKAPPPRASARGRREQSFPSTCRNRPRTSR